MTLYLIRHASAHHRRVHDLDDAVRTLDDYGTGQARQLAQTLGDVGISRLLSSRATRCLQTVGPLAHATGLPIEEHDVLFEGSSTSRVLELIRSFADTNVALCSHGDIIPDVIRALEVGGTIVHGQRRCAKGSIWQLELRDERIDTATYLDAVTPLD